MFYKGKLLEGIYNRQCDNGQMYDGVHIASKWNHARRRQAHIGSGKGKEIDKITSSQIPDLRPPDHHNRSLCQSFRCQYMFARW